jgi:hypothetical protein
MEADPGDEQVKPLVAAVAILLTAAALPPTYDWKLTPAGWGPVRIGMTRAQAEKALSIGLEGEAFDNEGSCIELYSPDERLTGLYFMFLDGKLSRVSAVEKATIKTPRGMGIGSTAEEVREAYGEKLQAEPHHYDGEPAEYLTYWLKPLKSGVRFETDPGRKVQTIHAGNESIQLIEGCA